MAVDSVYITNLDALTVKYGQSGASKIWNSLRGKNRVNLNNRGSLRFTPVTRVKDYKANKAAIDSIYNSLTPNYMVIVGASDVVPFQNLRNPMFSTKDPDRYAWGDIPYACAAPYSTDPAKFRAPTRVVGRIPDMVGGKDPQYLIDLLKAADAAKTRPASAYRKYLGVSADVWKGSTTESVQNIFGSSSNLQLSPTKGPKWTKSLLGTRAHFINCHGASANPFFYGQKGSSYPEAHSAAYIAGKISDGTVATAECCYGAELYNPSKSGGQAGICSTFLASGGYGFFGSSTIAYGPATGNGVADLITQYFLKHVLDGASLGRATLQAQQEYILAEASGSGAISPVALKTLAQFYLLGDPTIHAVEKPATHSIAGDRKLMRGLGENVISSAHAKVQRRQQLVRKGRALEDSVAYSRRSRKVKPARSVKTALNKMAKNLKLKNEEVQSFTVHGGAVPKSAFGLTVPKRIFHIVHGEIGRGHEAFTPTALILAEEQDGNIVSVNHYHRR